MLRIKTFSLLLSLVALSAFVACGGGHDGDHEADRMEEPAQVEPMPAPIPEPMAETASAALQGAEGSGITGKITFTQTADGTSYVGEVSGAGTGGMHGFHIHEIGDCSAADFTSAGGHFNPTDAIHGGPDNAEHHAGDLGNIEVGPAGNGRVSGSSSMLTVSAGPNSVVGRAVILHAGQDDLVTQPTGDAGGRLACGVIHAGG